jgi:hypothetical protein
MTIRVVVHNDDQRANAIIGVRQVPLLPFDAPASPADVRVVELKGGDKSVFWVHSGQKLEVSEVQG